MIPKIIHYCWLSDDPIPSELKMYMDSWKKVLPDYRIMKWDFSIFDKESSLWVKQAFDKKKYAFAADYIRLYAIYNYGGIYLDSDVEVLKSFNKYLDSDHLLGWEVENRGIEAAVIGAEKKAEWVKDCLAYYDKRNFIKSDGSFDTRPLPLILYDILKDSYINQVADNTCLNTNQNKQWLIYPKEFFSPKSYDDGKIYKTKNTVSIHHFAGSWLSWDAKLKKRYPCIEKVFYYCWELPLYELKKYHVLK